VSEVERLRVVAVQELHSVGELLASRLHDEVVVVAHEAERVAAPFVLRDGDSQQQEEEVPVAVVEEDRYPPGAARADVEDPLVRHLGARSPSHPSDGSPPPAVFSRRWNDCHTSATTGSAETAMAGTVPDMSLSGAAVGYTEPPGSTVST
jgi:hypothetical protein